MKGRIDESISFDNEGPDFNIVMGGRGHGKSLKLVYCCVVGIALRTPKANWRTDRARWWNCTRRAGLAERRCERCVPVWVWLTGVVKDIAKDVLQRGFGVKDVASTKDN